MVVVIIVAIGAALVLPQIMDRGDLQAHSAAGIVMSDLEYARDLAITTATPVTVTFNVNTESYTLTNASGNLIHPITKATPYTTAFAKLPGLTQVNILTVNFNSGNVVTFDATGVPLDASSNQITSDGYVDVQVGSHKWRITVGRVTGKVTSSGS